MPELSTLTDETLFNRYQGGDQAAFVILMRRYQAPIYGMILKSVYQAGLADDLFQDVFIKVVDRRDQFREAVSFKAWIYTICRNTLIDRARKKNRRPAEQSIFVDEEKPLEILQESPNLKADDYASGTQLTEIVEQLVNDLPPEQRETFYLKVKAELTFEEIGETMQVSVNTAKSRMRYALSQLRASIKKRGYLK